MQRSFKIVLLTVIAVLVLGTALIIRHISSPRIVGRAATPEGSELCLVQKFTWDGDLFNTGFVYRKPGGQWNWFYYDHEDFYWGHARFVLETNASVARIFRGDAEVITFDWATETYTMHRWKRTMTGPQGTMPPGWEPTMRR
jgi:hypothetical protein